MRFYPLSRTRPLTLFENGAERVREREKDGAPMFLGRVVGHVVSTQKDKVLSGQKLFVVEPLNVKYEDGTTKPASLGNTGRAIVCLDVVGCGEGQLVMVVQGSSARMTEPTRNLPADAVIVGIVDSAVFAGKTFYQTQG
jgi:ethanolamine utilization protein EutN